MQISLFKTQLLAGRVIPILFQDPGHFLVILWVFHSQFEFTLQSSIYGFLFFLFLFLFFSLLSSTLNGDSILPSISIYFKQGIFDQVTHPCCWKPFPFIFHFVNYDYKKQLHKQDQKQWNCHSVRFQCLCKMEYENVCLNLIQERDLSTTIPFQLCSITTVRVHLTLLNLHERNKLRYSSTKCILPSHFYKIGRRLRNFLLQGPNLTRKKITKHEQHSVKFWTRIWSSSSIPVSLLVCDSLNLIKKEKNPQSR